MKISHSQILLFILIATIFFSSCELNEYEREAKKWKVTLDRKDKKPYGTFLAYESLQAFFPDAKIEALPHSFRYSNMDYKMKYNFDSHSLIILEGLQFNVSDKEWEQLQSFVKNGNEIILFCSTLDNKIAEKLNCNKYSGSENQSGFYFYKNYEDSNKNILKLHKYSNTTYGYSGRDIRGHFYNKDLDSEDKKNAVKDTLTEIERDNAKNEEIDSTDEFEKKQKKHLYSKYYKNNENEDDTKINADTLGYALNKPDLIRYSIGKGHITIHAAPLVLSNYFLLQPNNINYLKGIWQTLPNNINKIYWNDYYSREGEEANMWILWKFPATRYALLLLIFGVLMYILFEGKRRQRIIPIIPPIKNDSVSFVETVGRLYYNKGEHTNLAQKMIQQYFEFIRTHYFLNTNILNESFAHQLSIKSGQPRAFVDSLLEQIFEIKTNSKKIDDAYLYQLYTSIQKFYNNKK